MADRLLASVALVLVLVGCSRRSDDGPPEDPERLRAISRLSDGRPVARITALRQLGPGANRYEVHAMARAAVGASEDVRREAAIALGEAGSALSVDLLGEMLRDPLDSVRAAAIGGLAKKQTAKADAFVVSAYEKGGPRTRAAIGLSAPRLLAKAVAAEANGRRARVDSVLHTDLRAEVEQARAKGRIADVPRPSAQLVATAIGELGLSGDAGAIPELISRLSSDEPLVVAAAAAALGEVGGATEAELLVKLLDAADPRTVVAACRAISRLPPQSRPIERLVQRAAEADPRTSSAALDALVSATVSPDGRNLLCESARSGQGGFDRALAVVLFAGESCVPDPSRPQEAARVRDWWLLQARRGASSPKLLSLARLDVNDSDGPIAAAAATYLGRFGTAQDASLLLKVATLEWSMTEQARAKATEARKAKTKEEFADADHHREELNETLTSLDLAPIATKPSKLGQLLAKRTLASDTLSVEARPGGLSVVAAAGAGAARLGAPIDALGRSLSSSASSVPQQIAVELADLSNGAESLRSQLRQSANRSVRLLMGLRDLAAGRDGAVVRLSADVSGLPAPLRDDVLTALADAGAEGRQAVLVALRDGDGAPRAVLEALARDPADAVDTVLDGLLASPGDLNATAVAEALALRPGERAAHSLASAAFHPSGAVRAAALRSLRTRGGCLDRTALAALSGDYERPVREAAAALLSACPSP